MPPERNMVTARIFYGRDVGLGHSVRFVSILRYLPHDLDSSQK